MRIDKRLNRGVYSPAAMRQAIDAKGRLFNVREFCRQAGITHTVFYRMQRSDLYHNFSEETLRRVISLLGMNDADFFVHDSAFSETDGT